MGATCKERLFHHIQRSAQCYKVIRLEMLLSFCAENFSPVLGLARVIFKARMAAIIRVRVWVGRPMAGAKVNYQNAFGKYPLAD